MDYLRFSSQWYGEHLPSHLGWEFSKFAAQSATLAERIALAPIKIDATAQSACTDGKTITLPGFYFLTKFYVNSRLAKSLSEIPAIAITLVNGSMLHEALHISLTVECNMAEMVVGNTEAEELIKSSSGFALVLGLVEDAYIEYVGRLMYETLSIFVSGKNAILFNEHELADRIVLFEKEPQLSNFLNMFICYKNLQNNEDECWKPFEKVTQLLVSARDEQLELEDRVAIAVAIWKLLSDEESKDEMGISESEDDVTDESKGEIPTHFDIDELIDDTEVALQELEEIFNIESEKQNKGKVELLESVFEENAIPETEYIDIMAYHVEDERERKDPPRLTADFEQFSRVFRYLNEVKHTLGRPSTSGTKIVKQRLYRILTDQKVLAYHTREAVVRGKPKIIMLADASGSTSGPLWEAILKAVYGAFISLQKANVNVAAYAHTSIKRRGRNHTPVVYGIAAHNMPLGKSSSICVSSNISNRFTAMSGINLFENFDGYALKLVADFFPRHAGTNVIIVLSDGQPSGGSEYRGKAAMAHTVSVVSEIRRTGTKVISLSLTKQVVEDNDEIYGKDANVSAFGGMLGKSLQKVVAKLILPQRG